MAAKAILYDVTKCTACRGCQTACKQWNELEAEKTINRGTYENPPSLSPNTWIKIKFDEVSIKGNGAIDWLFTRQSCMHCTDAACVKICPSGALYKHPLGFVDLDNDRCTGCGYCVEVCPFQVPHTTGSQVVGIQKAKKCTFCRDRVMNDYEPACVKTCPTGALRFDNRNVLLDVGFQRVREIKADYPQARLYGASELGGLHVMYVLPYHPDIHGLPADPQVPDAVAIHDVIQWASVWGTIALVVGIGASLMVTRASMISEKEDK